MANKYEKEIYKSKYIRDDLIANRLSTIFEVIRDKSQKLAMQVTIKAEDNAEYFQQYNRAEKFATETNETLRPEYIKKDAFSRKSYIDEYPTSYIESLYTVINQGIKDNYLVKLPKYTEQQFKKATNYPLSKLMNTAKMKNARSLDIEQVYTSIVSGVEQGLSLKNINRQLDIDLGFRDPQTGKWIGDVTDRKGQIYKSQRILRTEIGRMRATAETDQWINQQEILPSKLQLVEVLDNRTRSQSARMDGQIANEEGKFLFPNDNYSYAHRSGVAKWDINDRSTVVTLDPDYPANKRIQRDPKTNENSVKPYQNFEQYAKDNNLTRNIYGELLFK